MQSSANSTYSISTIAWKNVIRVASYVTFYPCSNRIPQIRTKVINFLKIQNAVTF